MVDGTTAYIAAVLIGLLLAGALMIAGKWLDLLSRNVLSIEARVKKLESGSTPPEQREGSEPGDAK